MAKTLMFHSDPIGAILYINKRSPYAEQESEEIGNEVIIEPTVRAGCLASSS
jgi:hypothetical protein